MTDRDWCNAQPDSAELNDAFDLAQASGMVTRSTIASLIHKLQEARRLADPKAISIDEQTAKRLLLGIAAEMARSGLVISTTPTGASPELVSRVSAVAQAALRSEEPAEQWFQDAGGNPTVMEIVLPKAPK